MFNEFIYTFGILYFQCMTGSSINVYFDTTYGGRNEVNSRGQRAVKSKGGVKVGEFSTFHTFQRSVIIYWQNILRGHVNQFNIFMALMSGAVS